MRHERRPDPHQAGLFRRLRARFTRARAERSAPGLFTARSSPNAGAPRPEPVVPSEAPGVRVHASRLDRGRDRPQLTPSQALELAREGPQALRRERPTAG